MARKTLKDRFDQFEDDFLEFKDVESPRHPRPDLCAFLMLHELDPKKKVDIVECANYEEIWLSIDLKKVAKASDDTIRDLVRCGIRLDEDRKMLAMFV